MPDKKHIMLVMPLSTYDWGSENCGGVDSVCQMFAECLTSNSSEQFNYTIVALDPRSHNRYTGEKIPLSDAVDLIWLPESSRQSRFKVPGIIWQNWHLRKIIQQEKPDLLHVHYSFLLLGTGHKGPTIATHHSYKKIGRRNFGFLNNFLYEKLVPKLTAHIPNINVVVGKQLQTVLLGDGVNSRVIHNPIANNFFNIKHSALDDKSQKIKLVTCALLTPKKNIEGALGILKELTAHNHRCSLDIIGPTASPEYKQSLVKLIQEFGLESQVAFLGKLNQQQILEVYKTADIGVFTSLEETFGLAPLEMLASGLPLISTEVGILKEEKAFFKEIGVIYLNDNFKPETLLAAVDTFNYDNALMAIKNKFHVNNIVAEYQTLYVDLLS